MTYRLTLALSGVLLAPLVAACADDPPRRHHDDDGSGATTSDGGNDAGGSGGMGLANPSGGSGGTGATGAAGGSGGTGGDPVDPAIHPALIDLPGGGWVLAPGQSEWATVDAVATSVDKTVFAGNFCGDLDLGTGPIHSDPYCDDVRVYLAALDATGHLLWITSFASDEAHIGQMTLDADGSIYLAGTAWSVSFGGNPMLLGNDAFVTKFDPNGNHLITVEVDADDGSVALALDGAGNIFVTGKYLNGIFVAELDPALSLLWHHAFHESGSDNRAFVDDIALAPAGTPAGAVAITGAYRGIVDFGDGPLPEADINGDYHGFLLYLDASGDPTLSIPLESGVAAPSSITFDTDGTAYWSGTYYEETPTGALIDLSHSVYHYAAHFIVKLDPDAAPEWSLGMQASVTAESVDIAITPSGTLISAGTVLGSVCTIGAPLGEYAPYALQLTADGACTGHESPGHGDYLQTTAAAYGPHPILVGHWNGYAVFNGTTLPSPHEDWDNSPDRIFITSLP